MTSILQIKYTYFIYLVTECFTQEWAMGLVPCLIEKFEPLLDLIPMGSRGHSSGRSLQSLGGHHKTKDKPAQLNKWYKLMHGMTAVHDEYQQALLSAMGGRIPHTKAEKEKENIAKKLLKIDFNTLKQEYVTQLMLLNDELEDRLESLIDVNIYTEKANMETFDKASLFIYDQCMLFLSNEELCRLLDNTYTCFINGNYTETDLEDNLKWVRCLYECR